MEKLHTAKEASRILGVHVRTLQKRDKQGKIRYARTVGGKRRRRSPRTSTPRNSTKKGK